jgi:hypothetical protein
MTAYLVVGFHLEEQRRKHADSFLTRNVTLIILAPKSSIRQRHSHTTSVSYTKNEWNFLNSGLLRKTFFGTLNCHARPSGYLRSRQSSSISETELAYQGIWLGGGIGSSSNTRSVRFGMCASLMTSFKVRATLYPL